MLIVHISLVGGIPTPLKNDGVRQLGLFFPNYGKNVSNHQPVHISDDRVKSG